MAVANPTPDLHPCTCACGLVRRMALDTVHMENLCRGAALGGGELRLKRRLCLLPLLSVRHHPDGCSSYTNTRRQKRNVDPRFVSVREKTDKKRKRRLCLYTDTRRQKRNAETTRKLQTFQQHSTKFRQERVHEIPCYSAQPTSPPHTTPPTSQPGERLCSAHSASPLPSAFSCRRLMAAAGWRRS